MQKDNIILKMKVMTSTTALLTAVMILLISAGPAWPADGKVIPLTDELKKALAPLGEGVVGKAIPSPVIHDPAKTIGMREGTFEFQFTKGAKDAGKNHNEVYSKLPSKDGNPLWSRNIGGEFIEEVEIKPDGSVHINDEIAVKYGYRCHFDPGLSVAQKVAPGESWELESKLSIYHVKKNQNKVAYRGKMSATRTYVGAYEVTTPAGKFDAYLLAEDYEIKVSPTKVKDKRYTFFAPGVGKVAEVEGLRVSAILIINIHQATAKVLTKYPKD
jgi:hypothetical protein